MMGYDWWKELKRIIDDTPGLSMKGVSLKAGLSESFVRDIVNRGSDGFGDAAAVDIFYNGPIGDFPACGRNRIKAG